VSGGDGRGLGFEFMATVVGVAEGAGVLDEVSYMPIARAPREDGALLWYNWEVLDRPA
jgi:hypothetical protein